MRNETFKPETRTWALGFQSRMLATAIKRQQHEEPLSEIIEARNLQRLERIALKLDLIASHTGEMVAMADCMQQQRDETRQAV